MAKGDFDWNALLNTAHPEWRRGRSIFRRLPHSPRCKMCAAPFAGPAAPLMRAIGRGRWVKNPNYCSLCEGFLHQHRGGAEAELSFLFADVRGSTALAERLAPRAFSELLNRFYEVSARVVIAHEGLVDKFVGDELVAMFPTPFAGPEHARAAVDTARDLLRETGHGSAEGPWVPIGAGVHTGIAFVGAVGEGAGTAFTALGDAVNTTARLASAAGAGEILVSRAAATAAGLDAGGLEQRHLELRGRAEPVDVLVLRESRQTPA